jgi:hypothetical protein
MNKHQIFLQVCRFVELSLHGLRVRLSEDDKKLFGNHKIIHGDHGYLEFESMYKLAAKSASSFKCSMRKKGSDKPLKYGELCELMEEIEHQIVYKHYVE